MGREATRSLGAASLDEMRRLFQLGLGDPTPEDHVSATEERQASGMYSSSSSGKWDSFGCRG